MSRRCVLVSLTQPLAAGSGPLCLSGGRNISPLAGPGCCSGSWPLGRACGSCVIDPCVLLLSVGTVYFIAPTLVYYPLVEMEAVHVCAGVQNQALWVWNIPAGLHVHDQEKQLWLCFSLCSVRLLGSSLAGVGNGRALLSFWTKGFKSRKAKQQ